ATGGTRNAPAPMQSVGIVVSRPPAVWFRSSASRIVSSSGETDATAGLRLSAARNNAAASIEGAIARAVPAAPPVGPRGVSGSGAGGPSGLPAAADPAARPPTRAISRFRRDPPGGRPLLGGPDRDRCPLGLGGEQLAAERLPVGPLTLGHQPPHQRELLLAVRERVRAHRHDTPAFAAEAVPPEFAVARRER